MPAGTVEVFLIGATGIKDTEVFGKADPYAVLYCGKQKLRSNTASNQGSKPVWNQKFSFYIDDTAVDLQIKIFNHNIFKEDDELGSTKIPLAKVFAESKLPTTVYNVVRPSGRVQGEVKLSISFTAKYKTGQQPPQSLPGPYNTKAHGSSPYKAAPPAPTVKHDPLTGPYGYYKNADSNSPGGSSHGASKSHSFASVSDLGSSKPYPPAGMYPPMPAVNATPGQYQHTDSSPSFNREDSTSSSSFGSSHGRPFQTAPAPPSSSDYTGSVYHESPYGQSPHGVGPISPASTAYPGHGHDSSYPPHGGGNQYDRVDDLSGRFGSMNVSLNDPHGSYSGYHRMPSFSNDRPPSGYPPREPATSDHHHYPPPGQPGGGYPPSPHGYAPQGYPPQFNSGSGAYPGSQSFHGYQAPPSSFYPPELGVAQQPYGRGDSGDPYSSNAYPPAPYYNAPPAHYVPAGYPK